MKISQSNYFVPSFNRLHRLWLFLLISKIHSFQSQPKTHPSSISSSPVILARRTTTLSARPKKSNPSPSPPIITSTLEIPPNKITQRLQQLTSHPNLAILIDAENLRGKTNFELSHADLFDRILIWAQLRNYAHGRTIVVVDHGSEASAHFLSKKQQRGVCITFAGPQVKADDIIARDTEWLLHQQNVHSVLVITADRELSFRCRHFANLDGVSTNKERRKLKKKSRKGRQLAIQRYNELEVDDDQDESGTNVTESMSNQNTTMRVNVIHSKRFLEDMEVTMKEWLMEAEAQLPAVSNVSPSIINERTNNEEGATRKTNHNRTTPTNDKYHNLLQIRTQILHLESCLRKKCTVRKRQQLTQEMRVWKERWEKELALIGTNIKNDNDGKSEEDVFQHLVTTSLSSSLSLNMPTTQSSNTQLLNLETEEQRQLLVRWGQRRGSSKREATEDRILLAEMIRSQLETVVPVEEEEGASLVEVYVNYINGMIT